ncbi:hypothetical protein [uncultured Algibacter sp.]|uniref:FKBP-type peptidyl-prolyl cis-trans isomerase n=1 Tax=uncultured Algibacter sp. TaxID=298659 RepID=UPI003217FAE8
MTKGKVTLFILILIISIISCKNDDDGFNLTAEPPRDRGIQQLADNDSIVKYLETHYYNSSAFDGSNTNPSIKDLIITEIEKGAAVPSGNTLLFDAVETKTTVSFETDYEYYILRLNQGGGAENDDLIDSPTFTDNIRMTYEGYYLDDTVFDGNNNLLPINFELINLIEGWRNVFPQFNTAESFIENTDGSLEYIKPGIGIMFLPSGLGYFNAPPNGIRIYAPLIFEFELLQYFESDHDNDGIPSYIDGLDENENRFTTIERLASVNTDGDNLVNFLDPDDDNDGVATRNEIEITTIEENTREEVLEVELEDNQVLLEKINIKRNQNTGMMSYVGTIITFTDTDNDGTPDYLDAN